MNGLRMGSVQYRLESREYRLETGEENMLLKNYKTMLRSKALGLNQVRFWDQSCKGLGEVHMLRSSPNVLG